VIKFFRNIRKQLLGEGNTSKYFKYAIGEILLVVIGILIALQINTWNEQRNAKIYEKKMLIEIVDDLKLDSTMIQAQRRRIKNFKNGIDSILALDKDYSKLDLSQISLFGGVYFISNIKAIETVKSGEIQIPFDDNLRKSISEHYHRSKFHMDLMNIEDKSFFQNRSIPIQEKYIELIQDTTKSNFDYDAKLINPEQLNNSIEFNNFILFRKSRVDRWEWAYNSVFDSTIRCIEAIQSYLEQTKAH